VECLESAGLGLFSAGSVVGSLQFAKARKVAETSINATVRKRLLNFDPLSSNMLILVIQEIIGS
jgi:hypothetical protein